MRYWWVNQNQTFRQEIAGGYLWSPKRNANGARNPFYESMREVAPGDLIFSFMDTRILAVGIVRSYAWESPKPAEFGSAGENWEGIGWRVQVQFTELGRRFFLSDRATRKQIFAEQVRKLRLFHIILAYLETQEEVSAETVTHDIATALPYENPEKILQTMIAWGRYAGLMDYNANTDMVTLPEEEEEEDEEKTAAEK